MRRVLSHAVTWAMCMNHMGLCLHSVSRVFFYASTGTLLLSNFFLCGCFFARWIRVRLSALCHFHDGLCCSGTPTHLECRDTSKKRKSQQQSQWVNSFPLLLFTHSHERR